MDAKRGISEAASGRDYAKNIAWTLRRLHTNSHPGPYCGSIAFRAFEFQADPMIAVAGIFKQHTLVEVAFVKPADHLENI
jgi:hypothetical protein